MAEWILWTKGLPLKPEVVHLARLLNISRFEAACRCMGDSTRVNVLAYAAWLVAVWYARRSPGSGGEGLTGYDALREAAAARNRRLSATGREIAPIPEVVHPERRVACEKDFRRFCETYFPAAFPLAWSGDHLKVIAKIEAAVLRGGQFGQAMPRGSGKTTLAEVACIWAIMYAHRRFVCLIGATAERAPVTGRTSSDSATRPRFCVLRDRSQPCRNRRRRCP